MSIELKKLTAQDGSDVYDFLQTLPKDENGFINGAAVFLLYYYLMPTLLSIF